MKEMPIAPIDIRKQVILKAVVTDYVRTAEPIGSEALVSRYDFGVKSATIRNELAELAEMGYLHQPHTSAGRIPSDRGYRYYVDRLMDTAILPKSAATNAMNKLHPHKTEVELILEQTCRILADLAHYTSVASHPEVEDAAIWHVSVASVGSRKLLIVMMLDNGQVLHELLESDTKSRPVDPIKATHYLHQMLNGKTFKTLGSIVPDATAPEMKNLLMKAMEFARRELAPVDEPDIALEGASYIMHQPEFKDASRLEMILSVLEQRRALYKLLSSAYLGPEVSVMIGAENPLSEMRDCSFVATTYRIRGRAAGTIGVLGPTRMDYRRAVGAVAFMARNLGELLTELSSL